MSQHSPLRSKAYPKVLKLNVLPHSQVHIPEIYVPGCPVLRALERSEKESIAPQVMSSVSLRCRFSVIIDVGDMVGG